LNPQLGYFTQYYCRMILAPRFRTSWLPAAPSIKDDAATQGPDALAPLAYYAANMLFQAMTIRHRRRFDASRRAGNIKFNADRTDYPGSQHNPIKSCSIQKVTTEGVKFETSVAPKRD